MPRILQRGESSSLVLQWDTAYLGVTPHFGHGRLKSIIVALSPAVNISSSGGEEGWTEVTSRKGRHVGEGSTVPQRRPHGQRSDRHRAFNASAGRDAFLSKFKGQCFRCLSKLHRRKDCRDPLRYIIYE